jgi:hypothetical protein
MPSRTKSVLQCCLLSLIVCAAGLAQEAERPACNAGNLGQFWPAEADHDRRLAAQLSRCGELQICKRGAWRYRWEALSVRVDQLSKDGHIRTPAGCAQGPETGSRDRRGVRRRSTTDSGH